VDQAHAIALDGQALAHGHRRGDAALEEAASMRSASSKLQARTRICELGLKDAQARKRPSWLSTRTVSPGSALPFPRCRQTPRVAAQQRTFFSFAQADHFHGRDCRLRARLARRSAALAAPDQQGEAQRGEAAPAPPQPRQLLQALQGILAQQAGQRRRSGCGLPGATARPAGGAGQQGIAHPFAEGLQRSSTSGWP
jgi:hypothetical protein